MRIDPQPVPTWLTDPDRPAPCPCGQPFKDDEDVYIVSMNDTGLQYACHERCLTVVDDE